MSRARWASVALLTAGVILVQLSMQEDAGAGDSSASDDGKKPLLGLIGVLVACGCSGLAGAVMEALLKAKDVPIARRNLQVSAISLVLAAAHMMSKDSATLFEHGFFQARAQRGKRGAGGEGRASWEESSGRGVCRGAGARHPGCVVYS